MPSQESHHRPEIFFVPSLSLAFSRAFLSRTFSSFLSLIVVVHSFKMAASFNISFLKKLPLKFEKLYENHRNARRLAMIMKVNVWNLVLIPIQVLFSSSLYVTRLRVGLFLSYLWVSQKAIKRKFVFQRRNKIWKKEKRKRELCWKKQRKTMKIPEI